MRGVFKARCADHKWIGCGSEGGTREEGEGDRGVAALRCHSLSDLREREERESERVRAEHGSRLRSVAWTHKLK